MENNLNKNESQENTKSHDKKGNAGRIVLIIVLLLIMALSGFVVYSVFFYKPSTTSQDPPPFDTSELNEPSSPESQNNDNTNNQEPPVSTNEMYNFLLIGKDSVALNTDVIMILNYRVSDRQISVMQLPRDTYVELGGYSYKINSLFSVFYSEGVNTGKSDPEAYGLEKFSSLLEQNLCLKIHYYALVKLEGFRNIVDILGGVEVDVPADMIYDDPDQDLHINIRKGRQVLNGSDAEGFVRFRSEYIQGDIGRLDAQKIFMSALLKKIKNSFNVTTIIKIANEVFKNVKTNVSLNDTVYFSKNILSVDMGSVNFMSMIGYCPPPAYSYYVINRKGAIDLINRYFNIYDFEITDSIFDKNRIFTCSRGENDYLNPYYLGDPKDMIGGSASTADEIDQGTITIPRY